ncbi:MAG: type II toxin-antitoxin system RelE/ParE family toxin [Candidatus Hydrogenedentes bacterium]|nr:type II toxin-antitoxin system RelE/ParE family toxin [Candidatus Hydrogenedentota bacterium]
MRTRPVEFHPEAEAELDAARAWYQERSPWAAWRLLIEVDRAIARIRENPLAGPRAFVRFRKRVVKHFPFCVYYHLVGESIRVLAVAHDRRNPGYWIGRV